VVPSSTTSFLSPLTTSVGRGGLLAVSQAAWDKKFNEKRKDSLRGH